MAYLKPPAFTRAVFNKLVMRFDMAGSSTLVVQRRSGGVEQRVPVVPIEVNDTRYVVSTRGESAWVRNVRAAGSLRLERRGASASYAVRELPVAERAPVLDAYRTQLGRTVKGYFEKLPDPADHPVFALTPVSSTN